MSITKYGYLYPPEPDSEEENFLAYLEDAGLTLEQYIKQKDEEYE